MKRRVGSRRATTTTTIELSERSLELNAEKQSAREKLVELRGVR